MCVIFYIFMLASGVFANGPCDTLERICWEKCGKPLIFPFRETCAEGADNLVTLCNLPPGCQCDIPIELQSRYSSLTTCVEKSCDSYDWTRLITGSTKWCQACGYDCNGNQENCISQNQFCTTNAGCGLLRMCDRWQCETGIGTCDEPTTPPTRRPTSVSTHVPTRVPTRVPTLPPTRVPTLSPTRTPTSAPTRSPTSAPTNITTRNITTTLEPSTSQAKSQTVQPTNEPTVQPTSQPTEDSKLSQLYVATAIGFWMCVFGIFAYAVYKVIMFHQSVPKQIVSVQRGLVELESNVSSSDDDDDYIREHVMPMATTKSTRQQLRKSMR